MLIDKMLQVKTAVTEAAASNEKVQSAVEKTTAVLDSGCKKIEQVLETADKAASKIIQPVSKVKNTLKTVGTAVNNSVIAPVKKLASSFASHFKRAEKPVVNQGEALIIYNNQKFVINKSPFVIGRENADITIPETYISKIHVIISYKDGKYRIADYDSTNGTKVNGTKLRPKVYYEIRDGYEIELSEKEKMIVYIN